MALIAVVDDMPVNRDLLSTLLRGLGHRIVEAGNGDEALELVRREKPDLVICDILMPVMDGYEFVRRLRADPSIADTPVAFLTAYYLEDDALKLARACGVDEIITKPFEPEQIVEMLGRLLTSPPVRHVVDHLPLPDELDELDRAHLRLMTDKLSEKVDELQVSNRRLSALVDLNLQLASQSSSPALLENVCNGARTLLGAAQGCIAVNGTNHEHLAYVGHSGLDAATVSQLGGFRIEDGILGTVMSERQPRTGVLDPPDAALLGLPAGYPEVRDFVAAPVMSLTATYGWICLANKIGGDRFTQDDQHLLGIVAAQAGRIYENGSLYAKIDRHAKALEREIVDRERAQRQLAAQYAVARILAEAENAQEASSRLLASICGDLDFCAGTLWAVDDDKDALRCVDGWCVPEGDCGDFVGETRKLLLTRSAALTGQAWDQGQAIWIADVQQVPAFARQSQAVAAGVHAGIALPIHARGQVVGIIDLFSRTAGEPDVGLIATLSTICGQIGQFFDREEQQRRILRLTRVYAVLSGINAAIVRIRDRRELFNEACRIAVEEGHFGMAWIGEMDPAGAQLIPVSVAGIQISTANLPLPVKDNAPISKALQDLSPVAVNDLSQSAPCNARVAEAQSRGLHSLVVLPLAVDKRAVGVIVLYAAEADFFTGEELAQLTELASDISFALSYIDKQDAIAYLAYYDALTALPNRTQLHERLMQALRDARRSPSEKVCVVMCNVNRFRHINDTFGRHVGDQLLREVAQRLKAIWPDSSNLARIPPDYFLGLISTQRDPAEVVHILDASMQQALEKPIVIGDHEIRISVSAGFSVFPGDGDDADTLIKNAEAALRQARTIGGSSLFYRPEMNALIAQNLLLENRLRAAVAREEFVLYYQPKISSASGGLTGLEALIRWIPANGEMVLPSEFIPMLEETGLILQIGQWAIRRAISDARRWREQGVAVPRIAVNVSAIQLQQEGFVDSVRSALAAANGQSAGIDLELTESMLMSDIQTNIARLNAIQSMGVGIAIDDFGTGYSSLGYLARLPVNALKIDSSFVNAMMDSSESAAIVTAIVSMAHSLHLRVIAEGVENAGQVDFLANLDCNELQGYLISQPLPADRMMEFLRHPPPFARPH
ncbi:MAG: EAL domain-containing protein [Betaproteobacteria bacterium]